MADLTRSADKARIDGIRERMRKTRIGKGRLILGLETVGRVATVRSWMTNLAHQTQVLVGRPVNISPWLTSHPDAIKEWGKQCRASGITKIADVAKHAIGVADSHPGERVTMMIVGDCFEEDQDDIYCSAPLLKSRGVRVIMAQDANNDHGEEVYQEFARLTDGTFMTPFEMNNPRELEKVLVKLQRAEKLKVLGGSK
jgi:hypothetical protein